MTVTARPDSGTGSAAAPVVRRANRRVRVAPMGHLPALDGLRALAVTAVLFYHARFGWAGGGFLGVSTFFTLSGFLITSLLLRERARSGAIDVRGFWSRRFRRLLAASWATIGVILAMGVLGVWNDDQLRSLRGDVPWALAELLNWHFILQGRSYGSQFEAPSPLEHYWSLAVEQQFYLVFPVVVAALLAWGARRRRAPHRPFVVVASVLAVASAVLCGVVAADDVTAAYFATPTRLAELLLGALLAVAFLRGFELPSGRPRLLAGAAGVAGLVGSLVLWNVAAVSAAWMYPWGLLASALCTLGLIVGALQPGPMARVLTLAPVVWLGKVSYGVYLLHWPVFLWLTPARTGWAPWPLFALRMAVTLTGAVVMFRLLEQPVRTRRRLVGRRAPAVAGLAAVALLAGTAFTTSDVPPPRALDQLTAGGAPPAAPPPVPLRVLVVGDQLAASTQGTLVVADADGDDERRDGEGEAARPLEVTTAATADCGLALGGHVRLADGSVERDTARCGPARDSWVAAANEQRPDVVAVWAGLRDVADRRFEPDEPWRNPSDPALVDFLRGQVADLLDQLSASGAPVAVLTVPYVANAATPAPLPSPPVFPDSYRQALVELREARIRTDIPPPGFAENDPARIDQWNALLREVAASRGIPVVDVAAQLQGWPEGPADPERRAGGVGLTAIGGAELAPWLSAQLSGVGPVVPAAPTSPSLDPAAPLPEPPPVTPRRRVPAGRPVSAVVVGDSVGFNFGTGLDTWARRTAGLRPVNAGKLGCSVARGGTYRFLRELQTFPENCDWSVTFPRILDEQRPDVAVLVSGVWEVVDRRLPGEDRFRHIGDPGVDRYLLREWLSAVDVLGAGGATVVLVTYPHFEAGRDVGFSGLPESDPARVDRLNELIREVAALRPGVAQVLDFQAWLASQPGGELDPAKRDDGLHFRDSFLPTIGAWLGPQLISLGRTGSPTPG